MMKNDTLNMLIGLNNQGVQLYITEEGWKVFLSMMQKEDLTSEEEFTVAE